MGKSMEMAIGTYSWMSFCKRRVLGFILFSTSSLHHSWDNELGSQTMAVACEKPLGIGFG